MKKIIFITVIFLASIHYLNAQQVIAVLQHQGTSTIFKDANSLVDANSAAQNGDTIYLSGGFFNTITISKRLVIYGAGHNPDSTKATGRTYLYSTLTLSSGADSSFIEGLYISGDITFQSDASMHDVVIRRCNFGNLNISGSGTKVNIRTLINQNIITGSIDLYDADALIFSNNILFGYIRNTSGNIVFDHNVFLIWVGNYAGVLFTVSNVLFTNNIFQITWGGYQSSFLSGDNNTFQNNLFNCDPTPWWNNAYTNNFINVNQDSIFINHPASIGFSYTQDYHLKSTSAGKNAATDGTDIGIYGGTTVYTFKEGSVPFNPHIISKTIAPNTDNSGNLNINVKIKAQDN
jgi:hypothetical protein